MTKVLANQILRSGQTNFRDVGVEGIFQWMYYNTTVLFPGPISSGSYQTTSGMGWIVC